MDENKKSADSGMEENKSLSAAEEASAAETSKDANYAGELKNNAAKKRTRGANASSKKEKKKDVSEPQKNTEIEKPSKWKSFLGLFEHTWFIILALVLAVAIVAAGIIGMVMAVNDYTLGEVFGIKVKRVDFLNDDLTEYLEISGDDYKNLEVDVNIRRPGDTDVKDKVVGALASAATEIENDSPQYNVPVGAGDKIYFYYTAYLKDENGNRISEVAGMSNLKDPDMRKPELASFVVGSGNFSFIYKNNYNNSSSLNVGYEKTYIHGFESGLIGALPTKLVFFHQGEIQKNDTVYATATYIDSAGILHDRENIRIVLSDENHESIWGEGVYDYIIEKDIGEQNLDPYTMKLKGSENKITFTNFTVDYITRGAETPATVKTVFPYDYSDENLRNKTVYFDIFIDNVVCYKTPEFNDKFVKETLKLTEERLKAYEGDTLTEKCKSYYLAMLTEDYENNRRLLAEEKLWEKLIETIEIEMPKREVQYDYEEYVDLYKWLFAKSNERGEGFESLDEYIINAEGLELGANWEVYIWDMLDEGVRKKLIFYSIIKNENITSEALEEFCDFELKRSYRQEEGKTRDDFASDKEYEEAIADYREEKVYLCGGEEEFMHEMYYRCASEIVFENAKVNDIIK